MVWLFINIKKGGNKMYCEKMLLDEIEKCRLLMVHLASRTSLSSHQVVGVSTRLDTLLNQYDKHKKQ
jgi:hypothetical protein